MTYDLTHALARAVEFAERIARERNAPAVLPVDILLGLIAEEEGRAVSLLTQAGLPANRIRAAVADSMSSMSSSSSTPFNEDVTCLKVMNRAGKLAREISADRVVGSEHCLLALLQTDEVLCRQLTQLGLSFDRLHEQVMSAQGPPLRLDDPLRLPDTTESFDAARIIDAGANRAREAMRVIEDYCRFALDDAFLSGELKNMRHEFAHCLDDFDPRLALAARETLRDVGTALSTEREGERHSLLDVAQTNLKRLQESLRSLEEFGKLRRSALGAAFESLRYKSYTLERAICLGTESRRRLVDAKLYVLLTGSQCAASLDWTIQEAAAGGAQIIQLREKDCNDRDLLDRARQVRRWTRQAGVLFIMNDRPDIARLVEADGVHLGQDDMPVKEARRILGHDSLIGVSTHNLDQVRQAILDGASYIGIGPTFPSGTKTFADFPGLDFIGQATAETTLPAFAIGGINQTNLPEALAAGAKRIAVSQAICQAQDPRRTAEEMRSLLDSV